MVEAWSYAGPYTIEANGTSGDPVTPPSPSRVGGSRVGEFLRRDTRRREHRSEAYPGYAAARSTAPTTQMGPFHRPAARVQRPRALDFQSRVQRVAQPAAEEIDPQHRHQDRQPRKARQPPRRR